MARRTIVLKAEASLSQAEWEARAQQFRVKKCLQCSAEPRDPDTDPGALARCRTACSTAAERCALQRSLQQSSAAAAATCSTEKEERARDLLQTFPRAAAWFPKRGAHTPEPLAAAECAVRAEQSKALSRGVAQAGRSSSSSSSRAALLLLLSNPCHNHDSRLPCHSPQKGGGTATKWLINCFLQSGWKFLQLCPILNSQVRQTGY